MGNGWRSPSVNLARVPGSREALGFSGADARGAEGPRGRDSLSSSMCSLSSIAATRWSMRTDPLSASNPQDAERKRPDQRLEHRDHEVLGDQRNGKLLKLRHFVDRGDDAGALLALAAAVVGSVDAHEARPAPGRGLRRWPVRRAGRSGGGTGPAWVSSMPRPSRGPGRRSDASFPAMKARISSSVRIRSVESVMIILR